MKGRRFLSWRWCPHPERMKVIRTRPTDRPWVQLVASALVLSLLAIQGIQMWAPTAINAAYPNSYSAFPAVEPISETPAQTKPSAQMTSVVSTEHMTVQFTFPESADPGETVTISVSTTARSSGKAISFSIEVFSYVDRQLVKTTSEKVVKDKKVRSGDTWQTSLAVVVPTNAQRAAMIGTVTEVWEETTSYYSPYYLPRYYYWPYYPYYPPYPYNYNYTVYYYVYEPSYVVTQKSSQQTLPLTYVLATTPEYEELVKKHEQLRQKYDELVAKHNELSSKYDSLRADYDQTVSKYKQLQSDYNSTTLELGNYRLITYVLMIVAAALGFALIFVLFRRRQVASPLKKQQERDQPTEKRKE